MKLRSLILATAFVALGTGVASAFGPSPSDANPPGALKYSNPDGFSSTVNAPSGWNDAPVNLWTQQPSTRGVRRHHR